MEEIAGRETRLTPRFPKCYCSLCTNASSASGPFIAHSWIAVGSTPFRRIASANSSTSTRFNSAMCAAFTLLLVFVIDLIAISDGLFRPSMSPMKVETTIDLDAVDRKYVEYGELLASGFAEQGTQFLQPRSLLRVTVEHRLKARQRAAPGGPRVRKVF